MNEIDLKQHQRRNKLYSNSTSNTSCRKACIKYMIPAKMEGECVVLPKLICFGRKRPIPGSKTNVKKHGSICALNFKTKKLGKSDLCGLEGNYDKSSEESIVKHKSKLPQYIDVKRTKSQIISRKCNTEEIKQKFDSIDRENTKIQTRMKSLFKSLIKKDKTIEELNIQTAELKLQLDEMVKSNAEHSVNIIELANINNRLEKEIQKKNEEIAELCVKIDKSETIKNNLLKDIEFYKGELQMFKNYKLSNVQKFSEQEYEKLQKKFYEIKTENGKLCRKFKQVISADDENSKNPSYHILSKKLETAQQNNIRLKMENKNLKEKLRRPNCDDEISYFVSDSTKLLNEETDKLTQIQKKLENENLELKQKITAREMELSSTKQLLGEFEVNIEEKMAYNKKCEEEIKKLKLKCMGLDKKVKTLKSEKEELIIKKNIDKENQLFHEKLEKSQMEVNSAKSLLKQFENNLDRRQSQNKAHESEIEHLRMKCSKLENEIKLLTSEKEHVMQQHLVNEENTNALKLKLDELYREKSMLLLQQNCSNAKEMIVDDLHCENCVLLKQELEKLGYANLRLNKEKQNLQSNFQKLSIKTSKLTIKMEELEQEKQKQINHQDERSAKYENDDNLLQNNVLLSQRLHDLLQKSEQLFKVQVVQQHTRTEKDDSPDSSNSNEMIKELNENLNYSKSNLESIEHKLNEEEYKLNAALKHIKLVKEQIQKDI